MQRTDISHARALLLPLAQGGTRWPQVSVRVWVELLLLTLAGAAIYGFVIGSWSGPRMAMYAAFKLPMVLEATTLLTLPFAWMLAIVAGLSLSFREVAVLTTLPLAVAAVLLASLAPIAAFFTTCTEPAGIAARAAHNWLYLAHTLFVGCAGLAGTVTLWRRLRLLAAPLSKLRVVFAVWVSIYALVGGEVAWAMRPFVGSVFLPVRFLRADALSGNVYEFVVTDILPYLLGR